MSNRKLFIVQVGTIGKLKLNAISKSDAINKAFDRNSSLEPNKEKYSVNKRPRIDKRVLAYTQKVQ